MINTFRLMRTFVLALLIASTATVPVQAQKFGKHGGVASQGSTYKPNGEPTGGTYSIDGITGAAALGPVTVTGGITATGTITGSNISGTNTGDQTTITGNAGSASKLLTPHLINGVAFDGTADITVPNSDPTVRLSAVNNLSDLTNVATARINLGLGTAAPFNAAAAGDNSATTLATSAFAQTLTTTLPVTTTGGVLTLTVGQASSNTIVVSGTLTSNASLYLGSGSAAFFNRQYRIVNNTTGSYTLTVYAAVTSPTGSVVIAQGKSTWVLTNGSAISVFTNDYSNAPINLATTDVTGTLAAARLPGFSGDVVIPAGTVNTTLTTVNTNVGTFGSALYTPVITVDGKGRITSVSAVATTGTAANGTPGGGSTGQVLRKNSNTDYDVSWSSLGTAATYATGTSGSTIPLINGSNLWGTGQQFTGQDGATVNANNAAIYFGYGGNASYRNAIVSRHNAGGPVNNALDFYLFNGGTSAIGDYPTLNIMTLDGSKGATIRGQVTSSGLLQQGSTFTRIESAPTNVPVGATGVGIELAISSGKSYILSYDRTNTAYAPMEFDSSSLTISGAISAQSNLNVGGTLAVTGKVTTGASTSAVSGFNIPSGSAPSSPVSGDIYNTAATLRYYDGTTSHKLAFQDGTIASLTTARSIASTGDVTWSTTFDGSANATGTATLATVNASTGTYGSSAIVPIITVDGKGRVTNVSSAAIGDNTAWTTYTPTLGCATGSLTSASASGRYKVIGKTVFLRINITVTTAGSCTGLNVTVPFAGVTGGGGGQQFAGRETAVGGKAVNGSLTDGASVMGVQFYDNTSTPANGNVFWISGTYESN